MLRFIFRSAAVCLPAALVILPGCQSTSDTAPPPGQATRSGLVPATSRHALLAAAIAGTDRIVVLPAGAGEAEPILDARGPRLAEEFLAHVRIDDLAGDFRCDCGPAHLVRFFRGDARLAELSLRRYQRWFRWHDGAWPGDAVARGEFPQQAFHGWFKLNGGEPMRLYPAGASGAVDTREEQDRRFAEYFPEPARNIARWVGMMTREGFEPWREESELANLVPDRMALATATFRALGMVRQPWHQDDYRIAATQTATAALSPDDFVRALAANATDEQAMRGAARVYFRMSVHRRLSPAANAEWLPRLADAMLRTGRRGDLADAMLHVAASRDEAAWRFLREIATGQRSYPWPTHCTPMMEAVHEPSLRAAAAVLLALGGDNRAPHLAAAAPHPILGLDQAAAEIAAALLDPAPPLRAAHFRYESRILTYAATEAALRRPIESIPASVLGSALLNNDYSFNRGIVRRLFPLAEKFDLQLLREPAEVNLSSAPIKQELVGTQPQEAIRQCTEKLPATRGHARTATLLLRALAHEGLNHVPEAIADYEAALKAGGFTGDKVHFRVALLYFRAARLIDAYRHVELGLRARPDADLFCLRGMIRYADDNFGPDADLDFTASLGVQRNHGYAEIFQHLCAHLSGRPRLSRLSGKAEYEVPPPHQILVGPGPSLSLDFSGGAIPPWPAAIIAFFKGELTAEQLLEKARAADAPTQRTQIAEAYFYLSQKARIARDVVSERDYLDRCLAQEATEVAEHRLAVIRRNSLR